MFKNNFFTLFIHMSGTRETSVLFLESTLLDTPEVHHQGGLPAKAIQGSTPHIPLSNPLNSSWSAPQKANQTQGLNIFTFFFCKLNLKGRRE